MKLIVKTETGSEYHVIESSMTWERVEQPTVENPFVPLRTLSGSLKQWPKVVVGQPMNLFGPPLTPGTDFRLIQTSPVLSVEEVLE